MNTASTRASRARRRQQAATKPEPASRARRTGAASRAAARNARKPLAEIPRQQAAARRRRRETVATDQPARKRVLVQGDDDEVTSDDETAADLQLFRDECSKLQEEVQASRHAVSRLESHLEKAQTELLASPASVAPPPAPPAAGSYIAGAAVAEAVADARAAATAEAEEGKAAAVAAAVAAALAEAEEGKAAAVAAALAEAEEGKAAAIAAAVAAALAEAEEGKAAAIAELEASMEVAVADEAHAAVQGEVEAAVEAAVAAARAAADEEKAAAVQELEAAVIGAQRKTEAAQREMEAAQRETEAAQRETEAARGQAEAAVQQQHQTAFELDQAVKERDQAVDERDQAQQAMRQAQQSLHKAQQSLQKAQNAAQERDQALAERDQALQAMRQAQSERDQAVQAKAAADQAKAAADQAKAAADQAKAAADHERQEQARELEAAAAELEAKEAARRALHNEMMELRGNVRVFCRVRPLLAGEEAHDDGRELFAFPDQLSTSCEISLAGAVEKSTSRWSESVRTYDFGFDHVFRPEASQRDVFAEVAPLVQSALDGYRVCVFAYGQTGSGKTHTMGGAGGAGGAGGEQAGVIARTVDLIFQRGRELREAHGWECSVSVQMLEIYNESIRDLLSDEPLPRGAKHDVRLGPDGQVVVTHMSQHEAGSPEAVHALLEAAAARRATKRTRMNARSSRSHSVFTMRLRRSDGRNGVLHLIDLAGSERLSVSGSGDNKKLLKEAQSINKSLSALSGVISALRARSSHVPFRDSKLTYMLQDSLGGDAKTLMFCQLSPAYRHWHESLCSLRFAQNVNKCEVSLPRG